MPNRRSIPAEIARVILTEAGHRCAVCGTPCPLERAHIIPWHKTREHRVEDLICLCANCHQRADLEKWGERTLREYKRRPWVIRQYENASNGLESRIERTRLELTIHMEVLDFNDKDRRWLQYAIAAFLEIQPNAVRIISTESGSVKVAIELPKQSAKKLFDAYKQNEPELARYLNYLVPRIHFDPYSLSLSILSALTAPNSLTYHWCDPVPKARDSVRRQVHQLAQVVYESATLLTNFRDFLKTNGVLEKRFQFGTAKILINEYDLEQIDQMRSSAFRVSRTFPNLLHNLLCCLAPHENEQLMKTLKKFEFFNEEAMLSPDYQGFLLNLLGSLSYLNDYVYGLGKTYEKDQDRLDKMFKYAKVFEDLVEIGVKPEVIDTATMKSQLLSPLPFELIWQVALIRNVAVLSEVASGSGSIAEEDVEGHLSLGEDERKGADFGVKVLDDSMKDDGILPGDIALIRQQPEVKLGEIAAVVIGTPLGPEGVLRKYYYAYGERADLSHWFLASSNPSSEHIVVIPKGATVPAIKALYDEAIRSGRMRVRYYEDAELVIAGKYVGVLRKD